MSPSHSILVAILVLAAGAAAAGAFARAGAVARGICGGVTVLGCALAAVAALYVLTGSSAPDALSWPWRVPGGSLALRLDPLGAWYALVVALVGIPCAAHGASYARELPPAKLRLFVTCLPVLIASLLLLAAAANALLFLAAWEAMTLAAFFLVVVRHEDATVRAAGWLYIAANHVGSFCLVGLIATLCADAPSFAFADLAPPPGVAPWLLATLWLTSFATKAGIMPAHIWLPHAHPAAPIPVSALLSGIVIKAGIFGLLRFLPCVSPLPPATGGVVLALGAVSGVLGVLYALAQHDLKRLLAYHSIENIGIILLGIGAGLTGLQAGMPLAAALGFAGALLHVLNHALFKALLFLGAGSVAHATGTAEIDRLGGLARLLPLSAVLFLIGCAAISGLPPLNGFVSEWLVLRGLFAGAVPGQGAGGLCAAGAIVALALIGGLALACFAKAFAATFLGVAREPALTEHAHEAPAVQCLAMAWLAALCIGIGALPQVAAGLVWPAALQACRLPDGGDLLPPPSLGGVSLVASVLLGLVAALLIARALLTRSPASREPTWGCGYSRPSPAMQYTASSFAAPLLSVFRRLLASRTHERRVEGQFPSAPDLRTHPHDGAETWAFRPLHAMLVLVCQLVRRAQRGPVQVQILYVMVVLALILLWKVSL